MAVERIERLERLTKNISDELALLKAERTRTRAKEQTAVMAESIAALTRVVRDLTIAVREMRGGRRT